MNPIRNLVSAALEIALTGFFGSSAHMLLAVGRVFPAAKALAVRIPELWGRAVLRWCHCGVLGYQLEQFLPSPSFNGTTVIICNHPILEDMPALIGALDAWGMHPALVSKVENLKGVTGFFARKVLQGIGRGAFIDRNSGGTAAVCKAAEQKEIILFPDAHQAPDNYTTDWSCLQWREPYVIVKTLLENQVPVRILNVTWLRNDEARWLRAVYKDVSGDFIVNSQVVTPFLFETQIIRLWRAKSDSCR